MSQRWIIGQAWTDMIAGPFWRIPCSVPPAPDVDTVEAAILSMRVVA